MHNTAVITGNHGHRTVTISHDGLELVTAWVVSDAEIRQLLREYAVQS
jgi:hypothetical protein